MKVTLLIPALNEIRGLHEYLPKIKKEWYDQLIVLDGGSKDGSAEFARKEGYEVYIQSRPGMRAAYLEVFPLIRGDIVVVFSPDGN